MQDRSARLLVFLMFVALVAGAWLRLWQIDLQIFIDDEWHALHRLMEAGYREIFLSFGHADYSIPLTLLFNWMSETIGVSERRMRFLPLLFGIGSIVLVPLVLRPWLTRIEQAMLALLVAISPLLIQFARVARPYAITIPLSLIAVVALWRWWHERKGIWLLAYVPLTVACAWLHPLTMMFTFGAASWFGLHGLRRGIAGEGWRSFAQIVAITFFTLVLCAALVLPPLLADPSAMASKAGIHRLAPETLLRAWEFYIGGAGLWMLLISSVLAVTGAVILIGRDRWFFMYWLYLFALTLLAILILDPAWIHHGLVLVRYSATAQPVVLALMAIGVVGIVHRLVKAKNAHLRNALTGGSLLLVSGCLVMLGPMPRIYDGLNQFSNSVRFHFGYDFDPEVNPYSAVMEEVIVHDFYDEFARMEGDWEVVESPWHFESHFNPMIEYQARHQRPVRIGMISGLCTDWTYGELRPDHDGHVTLRNFLFLRDLLHETPTRNRLIVFHRESPFGQVRALPDIEPCIDAFREHLGEPWYESDAAVVFRVFDGQRPADDV